MLMHFVADGGAGWMHLSTVARSAGKILSNERVESPYYLLSTLYNVIFNCKRRSLIILIFDNYTKISLLFFKFRHSSTPLKKYLPSF